MIFIPFAAHSQSAGSVNDNKWLLDVGALMNSSTELTLWAEDRVNVNLFLRS